MTGRSDDPTVHRSSVHAPVMPKRRRVSDAAFGGLGRSIRLAQAFRVEQTDPDFFYATQAADAVAQAARYLPLADRLVLDVGGGGGYFTQAFNAAGARAILIEPLAGRDPVESGVGNGLPRCAPTDHSRLSGGPATDGEVRARHAQAIRPGRLAPGCTIAGDGYELPVAAGVADLVFSSNVLEHVPDVAAIMSELVRVTRPGGLIYISFTTWYSPWGGHETAPWHYLGGERAARRYQRRTGRPPGNLFGQSLFARHAGPTLRDLRARRDVTIVDALPRYYPDWLRWLVMVPIIREFAAWNLLVILRRNPPGAEAVETPISR
jgi:SAM-dependent methyltransferase